MPSVLDNILAAPDIGLLAPEHMRASMPYYDDDPPPWQPLHLPHVVDMAADSHGRSPAPAVTAGTSHGTRREQPRQGVLQSAKPGLRSGQPESPFLSADSVEASSGAAMQAARSQEGDFFRLLDSPGPASRASFHERDLEQLPRSFSVSAKAKAPAPMDPTGPSREGDEERELTGKAQQAADLMSSPAGKPEKSADLPRLPAGDNGAAEAAQESEQDGARSDLQPATAVAPEHAEADRLALDSASPSQALQGPHPDPSAEGTAVTAEQMPEGHSDPQERPSAPDAEATALVSTSNDSTASCTDGSMPSQLQGSQHEAAPPPDNSTVPGLLGSAASSDLSYTQLTALLGDTGAQANDLSELDDLSPQSSPRSESNNMAAAEVEGLVAHAEAAAAAVPDTSHQMDSPFPAEVHIDQALDTAQADVMLPDQHDSSAGDADLAETLEQARDEQRLEQISQQHAANDLASNMKRLAVLTGRQGRPISHAEHTGHMQRLAKLTGTLPEILFAETYRPK